MSGTRGTSMRHLLEEPHKLVHEKGAESWFLIATPTSLGDMKTVRVWHSCSGLFPSWYGETFLLLFQLGVTLYYIIGLGDQTCDLLFILTRL